MFRTTGCCRMPTQHILIQGNAFTKLPVSRSFLTKYGNRSISGTKQPLSSVPVLQTLSSRPQFHGNGRIGSRLEAFPRKMPAIRDLRLFSTSTHRLQDVKKSRDAPVSGDKSAADISTSSVSAADVETSPTGEIDPAKAIQADIVGDRMPTHCILLTSTAIDQGYVRTERGSSSGLRFGPRWTASVRRNFAGYGFLRMGHAPGRHERIRCFPDRTTSGILFTHPGASSSFLWRGCELEDPTDCHESSYSLPLQIISALGAIHWGLEWAGYGGYHGYRRYAIGVLAPLLAWPTTLLPVEYALITQFVGFTFLYFADVSATTRGWTPPWYSTYRFVLTLIAGASIVITLIGRGEITGRTKYLPDTLRKIRNAEDTGHEMRADYETKKAKAIDATDKS
jgi:hypothetical protein